MSNANTALLTGASTSIGAVYADRLARRGHDLVLVARDEGRLNALATRLRAETGRSVDILTADLAARLDLLRVEHRLRKDPSIGMLVNNAGVVVAGPMHGSEVGRLEAMVNVNIKAALRLAHAAVESFVARGRGTLINVASVLALAPERFNAVYSGTKSFMLNLSIALQTELADTGIRVQVVLPGATRTGLWGKAGVDVSAMPEGMLMDADEMADAALAGLAPSVIGLGPGFVAGETVDMAIETAWGDELGRVIANGPPRALAGEPRSIEGVGCDRNVSTPTDGIWHKRRNIGDAVKAGQLVGWIVFRHPIGTPPQMRAKSLKVLGKLMDYRGPDQRRSGPR